VSAAGQNCFSCAEKNCRPADSRNRSANRKHKHLLKMRCRDVAT
jgi:hypothetical protein